MSAPVRRWGIDIEKWLRGLGLRQDAAAFRDNANDAEILPELTEADSRSLFAKQKPSAVRRRQARVYMMYAT